MSKRRRFNTVFSGDFYILYSKSDSHIPLVVYNRKVILTDENPLTPKIRPSISDGSNRYSLFPSNLIEGTHEPGVPKTFE